MESSNKTLKFSIRQIAMIGMLSAISIFLGLTGLGFIPIPPVKATIMHIPVIVGGILEGPIVGALVGLIFGLFSMYQAFTAPLPTSFMFWNPLIALVPRVLIGIVAYYVYYFLKNKFKNKTISIAVASVLATMTNTIGVMGLTYIIYLDRYAQALNISKETASAAILTVVTFNGSIEAVVCALICIPVILAVLKIKR